MRAARRPTAFSTANHHCGSADAPSIPTDSPTAISRTRLPAFAQRRAKIEVLKGPGSALFGSRPPGGSINIVHFAPSPRCRATARAARSVPSVLCRRASIPPGRHGEPGVNYRVDGLFAAVRRLPQHSKSADYELQAGGGAGPKTTTCTRSRSISVTSCDARYLRHPLFQRPASRQCAAQYRQIFDAVRLRQSGFRTSTADRCWWTGRTISPSTTVFLHLIAILASCVIPAADLADRRCTRRQLREQADHDNDSPINSSRCGNSTPVRSAISC